MTASSFEQLVDGLAGELDAARERTRRDQAMLEAISDAHARFVTAENPRNTFNDLLKSLFDLTASKWGFIDEILYPENGHSEPTVRAITTFERDERDEGRASQSPNGESDSAAREALSRAVVTTGAPVIITGAQHETGPGRLESQSLHAALGLPLLVKKDLVGVLGLAKAPCGYDQETIAYLRPMAKTCASLLVALRNDERRKRIDGTLGRLDAETLRDSETRFRQLADAMPQIVWTAQPDGSLDYYNQRWFDYTGMTFEQTRGWGWGPVLHPDDLELCIRRWSDAVATGESYEIKYRFKRASDGTFRWHLGRGFPARDECGRIVKWFGTCTDIEDVVRAEEKLRVSEDRFRHAVSTAPLPMLLHDEDDTVLTVSDGWTLLSGYTIQDIPTIGEWTKRAYGDSHRQVKAFIDTLFDLKQTETSGEWLVNTKDGDTRIWEFFSTPLGETSSGRRVLFSIALDVTDRRRAEDEVKVLNSSLEARVAERTAQLNLVNGELEAFSYSVAHDLRAPLRGVNGFSKILIERYGSQLDVEGRACIANIQSNAQKMGDLIDALLSLSRMTRVEMRPQLVDLTELAKRIARELAAREPERRVEVVIEERVRGQLDPRLARTLLENLLGNAWKFTARASSARVEFGTTTDNGTRTFFVRDNGAGFDMAYADKLFAPFQRLHTHAEYPGTGIGLATVQRIVRRHGGRIWAESSVHGGATFYFTLPAGLHRPSP